MSLELLLAWLRSIIAPPPPMPSLPDIRVIEAPRGLRSFPGFQRHWDSALSTVHERMLEWGEKAWSFLTVVNIETFNKAFVAGVVVGMAFGVFVGVAIYSRHINTLANKNAIRGK